MMNAIFFVPTLFLIMHRINLALGQTAPTNCSIGWIKLGSPPAPKCQCLKLIPTLPSGTTFMSAPKVCLNVDPRSSLLYYDGDAQQQSINSLAGPMASIYQLSNVPVGLYSDNAGNIRHLSDQAITPPLTNVIGKCQYLLTSGSFVTNNSCLQQPQSGICIMDCGNPAMPPAPKVTTGSTRCNDPNFNMTCPFDWINLDGLCYKNPVDSSTLLSRSVAASTCTGAGGWLPSFANLNEWQAVTNFVDNVGISGPDSWAAPLWLGGTLTGAVSSWDDGTPSSFAYWAPYQPLGQSPCMWWSVGQGDYWSEGNCTVPGVVFCQYYTCSTTTTTSTSSSTTTTSTKQTTTPSSANPTSTASQTTTGTSSPVLSATTSSAFSSIPPETTTTTATATSANGTTTTYRQATSAPTTSDISTSASKISTSTKPATTVTNASSVATPTLGTSTTMQTAKPTSTTGVIACTDKTTKDFSKVCTNVAGSFYSNGICYSIVPALLTYSVALATCQTTFHGSLATIRSADVFESLKKTFNRMYGTGPHEIWWIQQANNDSSYYAQLNKTVTMDGQYTLLVNQNDSLCSSAQWLDVAPAYLLITPTVCAGKYVAVCETLSQFQQKGCEQALNRGPCVVVETITSMNTTECARECAVRTWCTGFNFNYASQTCEILNENTLTQQLICESGWDYYERV